MKKKQKHIPATQVLSMAKVYSRPNKNGLTMMISWPKVAAALNKVNNVNWSKDYYWDIWLKETDPERWLARRDAGRLATQRSYERKHGKSPIKPYVLQEDLKADMLDCIGQLALELEQDPDPRLGQDPDLTQSSYEQRLDATLAEIKREKIKLQEERRVNKALNIKAAKNQLLFETIERVLKQPAVYNENIQIIDRADSVYRYFYSFGDVHYDYTYDDYRHGIKYNKMIAEARMWEIANIIVADVRANKYTEIHISDGADNIEGTALRSSQSLLVTEDMTTQAKEYANILSRVVRWVGDQLPEVKINLLLVSTDNHSQLRLFNSERNERPENLCLLITNTIATMINTAHDYDKLLNVQLFTADEILVTLESPSTRPYNVVIAHGHQYARKVSLFDQIEHRHRGIPHLYIGSHWHTFSLKTKGVKDDTLQTAIFLPAVVGDTDYAERNFLSGLPAFCKITVDLTNRTADAQLISLNS